MKTILSLLVSGALVLALSACDGRDAPDPVPPTAAPDQVPAQVHDDVQVVEIQVGQQGYSPARISLEAGIPARLIFTRTTEGGCLEEVAIPAFGVGSTPLPLNEPFAIEIMPEEAGTFTFACGMNMFEGAILVES